MVSTWLKECDVGAAYCNGHGIYVDKVEAIKWYRLSAAQGNAVAQCNLGDAFFEGNIVSVDKVESVKLYRLASA